LIALSVLGLGEILGSILFGKLLDKFGYKVMMYSCFGTLIVTIAFVCLYIAVFKFYMWTAAWICFLWGVSESGIGVFLQSVMGFEFESKTTTFAIRNLVQSFTVFGCLFLDAQLDS